MSKSLSKLTVPELNIHLVAAGLTVTGRKADLVKRLLDAGQVGEGSVPEHGIKRSAALGWSKF